jgi:hypothetical protein
MGQVWAKPLLAEGVKTQIWEITLLMLVMFLSKVSVTVNTQNLSSLDVTEWDELFFCPGDKQLAIRMACVSSMEHMMTGDEFVLPSQVL